MTNKGKIAVLGIGVVWVNIWLDAKHTRHIPMHIPDVLYVPEVQANVLAVSQLSRVGYVVTLSFNPIEGSICARLGGHMRSTRLSEPARITRSGGSHKLDTVTKPAEKATCEQIYSNSILGFYWPKDEAKRWELSYEDSFPTLMDVGEIVYVERELR